MDINVGSALHSDVGAALGMGVGRAAGSSDWSHFTLKTLLLPSSVMCKSPNDFGTPAPASVVRMLGPLALSCHSAFASSRMIPKIDLLIHTCDGFYSSDRRDLLPLT